jgi:hypothetical protein
MISLPFVIQTTVGRKNLVDIHLYATEILRRFAPLDDISWCLPDDITKIQHAETTIVKARKEV